VYWSKEEDEEDFLDVVVPHIERALMLLTGQLLYLYYIGSSHLKITQNLFNFRIP
jgi:hypothetical protein